MSLIVDVATEGIRTPLGQARIKDLAIGVLRAERVRDALVSIALVSPQRIARLNRRHLGHAGATDVISFALSDTRGASPREAVIGDIYIAPVIARANVARFGGSVRREIARLVVHGTLHVLGYDHPGGPERTDSPMWRRQERLLSRLGPDTASRGRA